MTGTYVFEEPNPTSFPQEEADEVRTWAQELDSWLAVADYVGAVSMPAGGFVAVVDATVQLIKDILGDPVKAIDAALGLGRIAPRPTGLGDALFDQLNTLGSYWEGGAHEAFAGHLDAVITRMGETADKLGVLAQTVGQTVDLVMGTYEDTLAFLHDTGEALATLSALPFSIVEVAEVLGDFAGSVHSLVEGNGATVNDYLSQIVELAIDAMSFPTLPENPDSIDRSDDAEDWEVQPT